MPYTSHLLAPYARVPDQAIPLLPSMGLTEHGLCAGALPVPDLLVHVDGPDVALVGHGHLAHRLAVHGRPLAPGGRVCGPGGVVEASVRLSTGLPLLKPYNGNKTD